MAWTSLCELEELTEGRGKYVEIDGFQMAVFRLGSDLYVVDNCCPHAGGNLAGGSIEGDCVVCPWHHWAFHLHNGKLRGSPGVTITTYKVRLLQRDAMPTLVQADLPTY